MASDADYMAFLDKANRQREAGHTTEHSSETVRTETVQSGVDVPPVLGRINAYYVSETDEPFEPVSLRWGDAKRGIWPDQEQFIALISNDPSKASSLAGTDAIQTLTPSSFDPRNKYAAVLNAVRDAAVSGLSDASVDPSGVEVKVFRIEVGSSRVEYWVVALEMGEGRIVGFRTKAVET